VDLVIDKARYVITTTSDGDLKIYSDRDIVIESGFITCFEAECPKPRGFTVINGRDKIVTPSFINILAYPVEGFLSLLITKPVFNLFERSLNSSECILDREDYRLLYRALCLKLLLTGYTGLIIASPQCNGVVEACSSMGLNIVVGHVLKRDLSEAETRGSKPTLVVVNVADLISDTEKILSMIRRAREAGQRILFRFSGFKHEVFKVKKSTGKWPIELIHSYGVLSRESLILNPFWISSMEIELLREIKPLISLSPSTAVYVGERGFIPLHVFVEKSIPLTISCDGFYNPFNPLMELKLAYLLQRYSFGNPRLSRDALLQNTLVNPRLALGLSSPYISSGMRAELNIYQLEISSIKDPIAYLYSETPLPRYTIVGAIVIDDHVRQLYEELLRDTLEKLGEKLYSMLAADAVCQLKRVENEIL